MENADLIRVLIATKLNFASTHGDRTESALRFPLMILSSVDLPVPFSPTRPITCPSSRDRLTSASALFFSEGLADPLEVEDATPVVHFPASRRLNRGQ